MPRKPYIISSSCPYFVTARCNNKEWFDIPMPIVWEIMENYLFFIKHAYGIQIHSFVLMANHFHLLVTTPDANLSQAMTYFMRETSRRLAKASGRINHIYGSRFHRSLLGGYHNYCNAYKYTYRNPVEAKAVARVETYRYSTLHSKLGLSKTVIPYEEDLLLFNSFERTLEWLNTSARREDRDALRRALRRNQFSLSKVESGRKPHPLEQTLY